MLRKPSIGTEEKTKRQLKVLFVSKHDACRGPMAESIFESIVDKNALKPYARFLWQTQSAGLVRYLPGNLPEQLALRVLAENNLSSVHGCRQVSSRDLEVIFLCFPPSHQTIVAIY